MSVHLAPFRRDRLNRGLPLFPRLRQGRVAGICENTASDFGPDCIASSGEVQFDLLVACVPLAWPRGLIFPVVRTPWLPEVPLKVT